VHPASGGEPAFGEVYVIGVDPGAQAGGLGRALLAAGLQHLHGGRLADGGSDGLDEVVLYVEAENTGAIALYESFGFTHADRDTDVMYASA
jgi:mycothiol synthase